ncbi:SLATT domain-containing protein [Amycolatopsis sp. H6(2020)]|nr:SLATT domain-containing protein [Amycolatopsis sp. H6(2020)]
MPAHAPQPAEFRRSAEAAKHPRRRCYIRRRVRRALRRTRKAFGLRLSTVLLSATISVLLGLRNVDGHADPFANIALGLGALITVLAAADAFFSHRELWILRTQTIRDLENISRELRYRTSKDNVFIISGRPAALSHPVLKLSRFAAAQLAPMGPDQISALVRRWHVPTSNPCRRSSRKAIVPRESWSPTPGPTRSPCSTTTST